MKRNSYNTPARRALLDFLRKNSERQFSSKEIADNFNYTGAPGKSTIYRQLSELCSLGIVRRYSGENKTPLYQYFSEGGCGEHFHMKCTNCGKLFHLECNELFSLEQHINQDHGFLIDRKNTILLGTCGKCGRGAENA